MNQPKKYVVDFLPFHRKLQNLLGMGRFSDLSKI